jgi:DNA polymerase
VHEVSGIPTLVTFHPSYILREEKMGDGMKVKRQVWEDMLTAMEILELPISAKQRGYFKAS